MRLQKEKAQPEHARPALPALDQRPALRLVQREMPQDRKPIRVLAGCLDRDLDIVRVPSGRMEHGCVDPALAHLLQAVLRGITRDLPVLPGRRTLRPDVDLSIDNQHGALPRCFRAASVMLRDVACFPIVSREADPSAGRTGSRDSTHGSDEFAQRHLSRTVPFDRRGSDPRDPPRPRADRVARPVRL